MAEKEKVTTMVLKVDLQCHKCYKKVKKVLCKFPQIRDQVYEEKHNHVVIKVVCCSPEKIRDRICSKGGGAIKSIEIKVPEKPKAADKPKEGEKPKSAEKPKEDEKPKSAEKPKEGEKPKSAEKAKEAEKPKEAEKTKTASDKPKEAEKSNPAATLVPLCYPPPYPLTLTGCCMDCYHGHHGGPCQSGYGGIAPYIQYDGYHGRPVYDSYGGGRSYSSNYGVARSDCFSEENPQGCTVM